MAEQKPHTVLLNKLTSLKDELRDYRETIKSIKETNPNDSIRDLLVSYQELKKQMDETTDELLMILIDIGTNTRELLNTVPPGSVSNRGMTVENASNQLSKLDFGGRKTRKHRKRR